MADALFIVQTNAVPGRESEFNDWYDRQHLHDVLAVPGFTAAQRFQLSSARRDPLAAPSPYGYFAIYEIAGEAQTALDELGRARERGMFISPALDPQTHTFTVLPISERFAR